jgi:hypothetical protein
MNTCERFASKHSTGLRTKILFSGVSLSLLALGAHAQQSASLTWSSASGATGYALYRGTAPGVYSQRIDVATNTTVTISGLGGGLTNFFTVTAYNAAGLESPAATPASLITTVTLPPPVIPVAPTNPVAFLPPPLAITNNGNLLLSAPAVAGSSWVLQSSTNLMSWNTIYTNAATQPLDYAISIPSGQTWRYYRGLAVAGTVNAGSIALAVTNGYLTANAVGFVRLNAPRGETLLANPFYSINNTIAALLPNPPAGTVVYQYTTGAGYSSNTFSGGHWSSPGMLLAPGEGAFLYNPSKTTQKLVFAGAVLQNAVTNPIPVGYSISSPAIPLTNSLATLPAAAGDVLQCYNGKWISYTNQSGAWLGSSKSPALSIEPGDAFFITKQTAVKWVENYWVGE